MKNLESLLRNCFWKTSHYTSRQISISSIHAAVDYKRIVVEESDSVRDLFKSDEFKPKLSPSRMHIPRISLPDHYFEYTKRLLRHEDVKLLQEESDKLFAHLRFRKPPIEEDEYVTKATRIEEDILEKDSFLEPFLSEQQLSKLKSTQHNRIRKELKKEIYHWEPIAFDHFKGLQYLIKRTPAEYAALVRVFHEINIRDPKFKPLSLLDFGSGTGTVIWAAQRFWSRTLLEHMCVDSCKEMNDIAELLTKKGLKNSEPIFPGLYFRQFLQESSARKYDMTISSYSMMELPSAQSRMEILDNLWGKTKQYFIIIEPGSNAGFEIINEARDFILQNYYDFVPKTQLAEGHVFAPCPHESPCPRYAADNTPCNFHVKYRPMLPFDKEYTHNELFSYVVFKKGPRSTKDENWPRIVREPLLRGKHVICRLCTKNGALEEAVLTKKKHTRSLYRCARKSRCGDFLPVKEVPIPEFDEEYEEEEEDESGSDDSENEKNNQR